MAHSRAQSREAIDLDLETRFPDSDHCTSESVRLQGKKENTPSQKGFCAQK